MENIKKKRICVIDLGSRIEQIGPDMEFGCESKRGGESTKERERGNAQLAEDSVGHRSTESVHVRDLNGTS